MKSKITKIQILKKGILLILMLAMIIPTSIQATTVVEELKLEESTAAEKLMYGEVGSVVLKIEEHFNTNTQLYIENETQLRALAEYVNSGNSCEGKIIELINDIEIDENIDWTPIGNSDNQFSGAFLGNGYTISNLTYNCSENNCYNIGLFGVVSEEGYIQGLNVVNSNIVSNGIDLANIYNVGNIAGINYGAIYDCTADKMPFGIDEVYEGNADNNYVGLLVGKNEGGLGNSVMQTLDDGTASYSVEALADGDERPQIIIYAYKILENTSCDVNDDGITNFDDWNILQMVFAERGDELGLTPEEIEEIKNGKGDYNGDGRVNIRDVTALQYDLSIYNYTNSNRVNYVFTISNSNEELLVEDVHVHNGNKKELSFKKTIIFNTVGSGTEYAYVIEVENNVPDGNIGLFQISVAEDAVVNESGLGNVRTEKIITVDRVKPRLLSCNITPNKVEGTDEIESIYFGFEFSEEITNYTGYELTVKVGGKAGKGEIVPAIYPNNSDKREFTYYRDSADRGKVEFLLNGTVIDVVGNESNEINETYETDIILKQTAIEKDGFKYYFYKDNINQNGLLSDFSNKTYFNNKNIIYVEKINLATSDLKLYYYQPQSNEEIQCNYMTLVDPESGETIGDVTFSSTSGGLDISEANIWIDSVAPQMYFDTGVDRDYKEGDTIEIDITTDDLKTSKNERLEVIFGGRQGGNGDASLIEKTIDDTGVVNWRYKYVVTEGDNGQLKLRFNGEFRDYADNEERQYECVFENIYVDSTEPTVTITPNPEGPTNADKITYTFKWNEEVSDFTAEDITVNNGTKGKFSDDGDTYTLEVNSSIAEGDVQVIVEAGVCTDSAGNSNIRQENNIVIDKTRPTILSTDMEKNPDNDDVKVTVVFSEPVHATSDNFKLILKSLNDDYEYEMYGRTISTNSNVISLEFSKKIYQKGGEFELWFICDSIKDEAQNEMLSVAPMSLGNATFKQSAMEHGDGIVTFYKNGNKITDISKPTYFVKDDIIGINYSYTNNAGYSVTEEYSYKVEEEIDLTHMTEIHTYIQGTTIEKASDEIIYMEAIDQNTRTFDISEANIYFDTKEPEMNITKINAEGKRNEAITAGDKIIITAITSEELDDVDSYLNLSSARVKLGDKYGLYNNGYAELVEINKTDTGLTECKYEYIVSIGDNGSVEVEIDYNNKLKDLAGNYSITSKLAVKEEQNLIADTAAPTVEITADKTAPTSANKITYTFTWSEEVIGFTVDDIEDDIIVVNGEKSNFKQSETDPKVYTIDVEPTIAGGNQGTVQVKVEAGACYDIVGLNNIRQEHSLTVDKVKPTLISATATKQDGKIVIEATFSEDISDASDLEPSITIGGNNYRGTREDAEIIDGNKVRFEYNISGADGGKVEVSLNGNVKDSAGNNSEILNTTVENDIILEQTVVKDETTGVIYSIKKNSQDILDFTYPTYFLEGDSITINKRIGANLAVYVYTIEEDIQLSHMKYVTLIAAQDDVGTATFSTTETEGSIDISEANIWFDTVAPKVTTQITANNPKTEGPYSDGEEFTIKATTTERIQEGYIVPEIEIKFGGNVSKFNNGKAQYVETVNNEDGTTTWVYRYIATEGDEGEVSLSYVSGQVTDLAGNTTELTTLNGGNNSDIFNTFDIEIDATAPTVEIITDKTNPTSANKITYTFKWSEKVVGFTAEDIVVSYGTKGELSNEIDNGDGTYSYTIEVVDENRISGELRVSIEKGTCKDLVGHENVRNEKTVIKDHIEPMLQVIEAFGSGYNVSEEVSNVKEYYKPGDTIIIEAVFDEYIRGIPELVIEFSESGTVKVNGLVENNKIQYSYTIKDTDKGELSVRAFTGSVEDLAGNVTEVTKRELVGNTIIVDNDGPTLNKITAIAPAFEYNDIMVEADTERYGVQSKTRTNNQIEIIAEYSENVYCLNENTINRITASSAPVLRLKFGTGTIRTATFSKVEGNKIHYTYNVSSGDNGNLSIVSLGGTVYDIAGNTCTTNTTLPELDTYEGSESVSYIKADTTKPVVQLSLTAENRDDNGNVITGTGIYYKKEAIVTITATVDEYVYKNTDKSLVQYTTSNAPTLNIAFTGDETNSNREATCTDVKYEDGKTVFTYEYKIEEGDKEELKVSFNASQCYDVALNTNDKAEKTQHNIYADTQKPVTNWLAWVEDEGYGIVDNKDGTWDVTFSEILYTYNPNIPNSYARGNELTNSNKSSAPILLLSNGTDEFKTTVKNISRDDEEIRTKITYQIVGEYKRNIGAKGFEFANITDRAGNLFNATETKAPTLSNIRVIAPETGTYREGQEVTIVATFSETLDGTAPKLELQFSESGDAKGRVTEGLINGKTITYKYTITANDNKGNGDNGRLSIKSFTGTGLTDMSDNVWVEETKALAGNTITADTIAPTILKIEAKDGEDVIGYAEKPNTYVSGRTNVDTFEYVITYSEDVDVINPDELEDAIQVLNAEKVEVKHDGKDKLIVVVKTTTEGVQSIMIPANIVQDKVGYQCEEFLRFNGITTDFTEPTIRFVSENNGGIYVIPTSIGKVEITPNVEINEDISEIGYKWDNEPDEPYEQIKEYASASDVVIPTKQFTTAGNHILYVKATDIAGNVKVASKKYSIEDSKIEINVSTYEITNQPVIATVEFGEGLSYNRKVEFKPEGSNEYRGINPSAEGYVINENGTIYAEATDKVGNKVFAEEVIDNIDTEELDFEIYGNVENWTSGNVELYVYTESEIASITVNGEAINIEERTYSVEENGEYVFVVTDKYGNTATDKVEVTKIDKDAPIIQENIEINGKEITITANDGNGSEVAEYAITKTTETPIKWSSSNVIKTTEDGTFYVWAKDNVGNISMLPEPIIVDTIKLEIEVTGNATEWTNQDIELVVKANKELSSLKMGETDIDLTNPKVVITENGTYEFTAIDKYGTPISKTIVVNKIDKVAPQISNVENDGRKITITANDTNGSGVVEYAISTTTEKPGEWCDESVINTTEDGTFYAWAKDNAGNISIAKITDAQGNVSIREIIIDTTVPTITFNYSSLLVEVGQKASATITTDEDAIISYSWDNQKWINSQEFITSVSVFENTQSVGTYTLYAKATDKSGNASKVQTLKFTVITPEEENEVPEVLFDDLETVQVDGIKYVKVLHGMTSENVTEKMDTEALCGATPVYEKLTDDSQLKTGTEITVGGETKYIIIVNGDVDCDGKVTFLGDVVMANNYRIGQIRLSTIQKLAADINNNGVIDFISDIVAMNNYRLGITKSL